MTWIFVSSYRIDDPLTAALIERLRNESFSVLHSPRNPADGEDVRWSDWCNSGCQVELRRVSIFIAVIGSAWDCSTWMGHECHEALKQMGASKIRKIYYWNPEKLKVKAAGMVPYLTARLPDSLDGLISALREHQ